MRKTALRLAKLTLSTSVAITPLLLSGCENPHRLADKQTTETSKDIQTKRISANSVDKLRAIAGQYDQLAAAPDVTEYTRAALQSQAGQVHLQLALTFRANLRDDELQIARSIADLQQLVLQVASAQSYGKTLAGNDPAELLKSNAQAQADTKASIDKLDASIAANNKALKDLQDKDAQLLSQRTQCLADAEKLLAQSRGESGTSLANDLIQSSQKRRDAAVADAQRATVASQIAHVQQQIAQDTSIKETQTAYAKSLADQAQTMQHCWEQIGDQIKAQQTVAEQIIAGGFTVPPQDEPYKNGKVTSVAQHAAKLKDRWDQATADRKELLSELTKADALYGQAAKLAGSFRSELVTKSRSPDAGGNLNVQAPIYLSLSETLHPDCFKSEQAMAQLIRASAMASDAILQQELSTLLNGFTVEGKSLEAAYVRFKLPPGGSRAVPGLTALMETQTAGIDKAKEAVSKLSVPTKEQISVANEAVDKLFAEADALIANPAAVGTSAEQRKVAMERLQAAINREWAIFDRFIGNPNAANHDSVSQRIEDDLKQFAPATVAPAVYTAPATPAPATPTTQPAEATTPAAPTN